jgi:hypothetical protein
MPDSTHITHVARRFRSLLALAALAWLPVLVLVLGIVVLGGVDALRANVFLTVVASHVAMVAGYALAVPAMLRVLHADAALGDALRDAAAARTWLVNAGFALCAVPVSLLAVSVWPEVWGTVSEVLAVQMLAVAPIVMVCQLAWMQQVAEGGDTPTIAYDTFHLLRGCTRELAVALVPVYVLLFGVLAANLVPLLTAPLALTLASVPFTVWTWHSWCRATGARAVWEEPVRGVRRDANAAATGATETRRVAPILLGGGGPAKLECYTAAGTAEGAWLHLDSGDTFTVSVRAPYGEAGEWCVYLWRPGGLWRELEQLWNDGRTLIAHGTSWGDRAYVAVARRDGAAGLPFTMWVSVATQSVPQQGITDSSAQVAA